MFTAVGGKVASLLWMESEGRGVGVDVAVGRGCSRIDIPWSSNHQRNFGELTLWRDNGTPLANH